MEAAVAVVGPEIRSGVGAETLGGNESVLHTRTHNSKDMQVWLAREIETCTQQTNPVSDKKNKLTEENISMQE